MQTTKDREKERGETKIKFEQRSPRSDLEFLDQNLTEKEEKVLPAAVRNKKVIPPFIKKLEKTREENCISNTKTDPTE